MAESRVSADRTVHVVDDDAAVRRSLERLLDTAGFRVVSYASSSAFLEAAPGLSAGCGAPDLPMPGVAGLAVPAGPYRPGGPPTVVVVSAAGEGARRGQGRDDG